MRANREVKKKEISKLLVSFFWVPEYFTVPLQQDFWKFKDFEKGNKIFSGNWKLVYLCVNNMDGFLIRSKAQSFESKHTLVELHARKGCLVGRNVRTYLIVLIIWLCCGQNVQSFVDSISVNSQSFGTRIHSSSCTQQKLWCSEILNPWFAYS